MLVRVRSQESNEKTLLSGCCYHRGNLRKRIWIQSSRFTRGQHSSLHGLPFALFLFMTLTALGSRSFLPGVRKFHRFPRTGPRVLRPFGRLPMSLHHVHPVETVDRMMAGRRQYRLLPWCLSCSRRFPFTYPLPFLSHSDSGVVV